MSNVKNYFDHAKKDGDNTVHFEGTLQFGEISSYEGQEVADKLDSGVIVMNSLEKVDETTPTAITGNGFTLLDTGAAISFAKTIISPIVGARKVIKDIDPSTVAVTVSGAGVQFRDGGSIYSSMTFNAAGEEIEMIQYYENTADWFIIRNNGVTLNT